MYCFNIYYDLMVETTIPNVHCRLPGLDLKFLWQIASFKVKEWYKYFFRHCVGGGTGFFGGKPLV